MSFTNLYKPPVSNENIADFSKFFYQELYDLNTNIRVPPLLETARVQLVPFVPYVYSYHFNSGLFKDQATLARYLPSGWSTDQHGLITFIETAIRRDPSSTLFAIIDKTQPIVDLRFVGRVAGIIGWQRASPTDLSLEIGPVIVFPAYQRSFVCSNAVGLLLRYVLDPPALGGLGFRRVTWTANPLNDKSITVAQKMGFRREGAMRWTSVLPVGKDGNPAPEEWGQGNGQDSISFSVCWDDWVGGVKESVMMRMERVAKE